MSRPAIGKWAAKTVRVGATGDGHKMKLIELSVAWDMPRSIRRCWRSAQKVGLSPQTFDSGLRGSRMDCGFYQTFFSYVLDRNRDAHKFTLSNAHKDMKYLASMAQNAGVANPVGGAVKNYYAHGRKRPGIAEDFVPMLSDFVAGLNGVALAESKQAGGRVVSRNAAPLRCACYSGLGNGSLIGRFRRFHSRNSMNITKVQTIRKDRAAGGNCDWGDSCLR